MPARTTRENKIGNSVLHNLRKSTLVSGLLCSTEQDDENGEISTFYFLFFDINEYSSFIWKEENRGKFGSTEKLRGRFVESVDVTWNGKNILKIILIFRNLTFMCLNLFLDGKF